jgi:hypothetical protein
MIAVIKFVHFYVQSLTLKRTNKLNIKFDKTYKIIFESYFDLISEIIHSLFKLFY